MVIPCPRVDLHRKRMQHACISGCSCSISILVDDLQRVGDQIGASDRHGDDQVLGIIFGFGDLYTEFLIHTSELFGFQRSFSLGSYGASSIRYGRHSWINQIMASPPSDESAHRK